MPVRSSHLLGNSRAGLVSSTVLLRIEFTATDASTPMRALLPHVSTLTASAQTPHTSLRRRRQSASVSLRLLYREKQRFPRLKPKSNAGCTFPNSLRYRRGGIFLLHFSSDRSGRALPVILALWSPDFPHDAAVGPHPATVRPGRVCIVPDSRPNVKQVAIFFWGGYNGANNRKRGFNHEREGFCIF